MLSIIESLFPISVKTHTHIHTLKERDTGPSKSYFLKTQSFSLLLYFSCLSSLPCCLRYRARVFLLRQPLPRPSPPTELYSQKRRILPASNRARDHTNESKNKKWKMKFGQPRTFLKSQSFESYPLDPAILSHYLALLPRYGVFLYQKKPIPASNVPLFGIFQTRKLATFEEKKEPLNIFLIKSG